MFPASIPSDPLTLLAALFTLFGLPLLIFGFVLFYAGYIRHDADQTLAELEDADESPETELSDPAAEGTDTETASSPPSGTDEPNGTAETATPNSDRKDAATLETDLDDQ
ncbi:hypothetical protein [Natronolimnobius baerhuensis]|uniref:Uncharacterized protein n=1 Tax=Natronolimnobius baerhuensis TaxID=253108 RepID=A0A202E8D5_9EURY|nr:hypothetical protein [Natronolimnobius baerhuensis]OVE84523.1 hypothetical protein B2G88_08955 [Natronolimnobius baerhuensis]